MSEPNGTTDDLGAVVEPGDVVQIDPAHDDRFGGALLIVTDVYPWGAMGFVAVGNLTVAGAVTTTGGLAYYRVPSRAMVRIGAAEWFPEEQE